MGIVTGDPFAMKLALEYGFEVIADPDNPGETGAIEMATRICVARGIDNTLVIPADIPLIQAGSLKKFLSRPQKKEAFWSQRGTDEAPTPPSDVRQIYSHYASGTTASNHITLPPRQPASRALC